jgi:competence protein ComEC
MEKSNAHWKAANPLLFIAGTLMVGIIMASLFLSPYHSPLNAITIIAIGLIMLQAILLLPIHSLFRSLLVLLILLSWGVSIYLATQEKNLIRLPYPKHWVELCRSWVVEKINASIISKEANGFALALLLGVKSDLNKELLKAYTQLGIIHIVAISGMHLEIIFKNLARITKWMPRKKYYLLLELLLVLAGVWLYTLMAFASPSILRASVFFSIYFIGKFLQQSSFTLNTIAGGVLILLLFDVKGIENIGLQLSYGAVLGIHLFYPLFHKMLPMDNPILSFLWSNLCVSFTAQLMTLPILVFHFHQIATLVIVSNFIMVPLSNILLYSLVILVICPPLFGLTIIMGQWIQYYILWINNCVRYFYEQPISSSFKMDFDKIQVALYYLVLWLIYRWLHQKQAIYLLYLLVLIVGYRLLKLFSLV